MSFDKNKQPIDLPYLQYTLTDDEPVILGTQGRDEMVFHGEIKAMPAPSSPFSSLVNDGDLELLYVDHPFNWAVNHALYRLRDAGILTDVHRYRMSYCQLRSLKRKNKKLTQSIGAIQKEQEAHNGEIHAFTEHIKGIKERLTAARVQTRIHPILARLFIEGMHQDPLYPYGRYPNVPKEDEAMEAVSPAESSIGKPLEEREERVKVAVEGLKRLLKGRARSTTPLVQPSNVSFPLPVVVPPSPTLSYHVTTPVEERGRTSPSDALSSHPFSPPEREPTQSCSGTPGPSLMLTIPPHVADYFAGNPRGPHH